MSRVEATRSASSIARLPVPSQVVGFIETHAASEAEWKALLGVSARRWDGRWWMEFDRGRTETIDADAARLEAELTAEWDLLRRRIGRES